MKDISCFDLETPGLNEWIDGRVKPLRSLKAWGRWMWAYHIAAEDLNRVRNTNLNGQDLIDIARQQIHAQQYLRIEHTRTLDSVR